MDKFNEDFMRSLLSNLENTSWDQYMKKLLNIKYIV